MWYPETLIRVQRVYASITQESKVSFTRECGVLPARLRWMIKPSSPQPIVRILSDAVDR